MTRDLRLLVVDDDIKEYCTCSALNKAIVKLSTEGLIWSYHNCVQGKTLDAFENSDYNAIMVDNDFGEGAKTLKMLVFNEIQKKVPVAYISAYGLDGLIWQYDLMKAKEPLKLIPPREFEKLGIVLIRKMGKNVSKEITPEDMSKAIYEFLKEVSR